VSGFFFLRQRQQEGREQRTQKLEDTQMADQPKATSNKTKTKTKTLSLDGWAVAIALFLAALVRLGVLKHVAW
jgi:hypothetical protein